MSDDVSSSHELMGMILFFMCMLSGSVMSDSVQSHGL